ncbi:unnamed protein product [Paramecium sonneborni]|uniref:Uncharacterized protein n=1 Tax=Paramecium sonneborni TaxID=65129 RepID=A0A8S1QW25_9CILI|nr:unnamed protein product [Paramecium sonneborni]
MLIMFRNITNNLEYINDILQQKEQQKNLLLMIINKVLNLKYRYMILNKQQSIMIYMNIFQFQNQIQIHLYIMHNLWKNIHQQRILQNQNLEYQNFYHLIKNQNNINNQQSDIKHIIYHDQYSKVIHNQFKNQIQQNLYLHTFHQLNQ